jgi:hypothetical protein
MRKTTSTLPFFGTSERRIARTFNGVVEDIALG